MVAYRREEMVLNPWGGGEISPPPLAFCKLLEKKLELKLHDISKMRLDGYKACLQA